jgi:serine/threonine protein kinase
LLGLVPILSNWRPPIAGGELFSKVVDNGCLDEADALFYFRQILEGIMYCHERKLCHRDMKLENLLLDQTQQTVKITDFGFAKNLADGAASTVLGTAVYVAPEVLNGSEYDGFKVDMWACGVILFAMVAGCYPFDFGYHGGVGPDQKGQNAQLMRALMKAEYDLPSDVAAPIADLLTHLIQPDPAKRFSAVDALKHPWLLGADRAAEDVDAMQKAMSHAYITTPAGDNPDQWMEKIRAVGQDDGSQASGVDVDFEEEDGF